MGPNILSVNILILGYVGPMNNSKPHPERPYGVHGNLSWPMYYICIITNRFMYTPENAVFLVIDVRYMYECAAFAWACQRYFSVQLFKAPLA